MFNEDLSVFFKFNEFAVLATWEPSTGSPIETALVLVDSPDQEFFSGAVISPERIMVYQIGDFVGLVEHETISIEGKSFYTGEPRAIEDGKLYRCTLVMQQENNN